jgi:hypothetical protein
MEEGSVMFSSPYFVVFLLSQTHTSVIPAVFHHLLSSLCIPKDLKTIRFTASKPELFLHMMQHKFFTDPPVTNAAFQYSAKKYI